MLGMKKNKKVLLEIDVGTNVDMTDTQFIESLHEELAKIETSLNASAIRFHVTNIEIQNDRYTKQQQ